MTHIEKLKKLYDMEINIYLSSFWDLGWIAYIGDNINGQNSHAVFDTVEDAIDYLYEKGIEQCTLDKK